MEREKITLREVAELAGVSPSLIYHYIKNGLLQKPERIPNTKKGRGALAVYNKSILQNISKIQNELKKTHSINQVKERLNMTPQEKEKIVINKLKELLNLAKQRKHSDASFKQELEKLTGFVVSPSLASTCYSGEKFE